MNKCYHAWLTKFFRCLIKEGYHLGPEPTLTYLSPENLVSLARDSFEQNEVLKIFRMPLFAGYLSRARIWQPGDYFIQSNLYWTYILALLTGMRPSEVGQLRVSDLERGKIAMMNERLAARASITQSRHRERPISKSMDRKTRCAARRRGALHHSNQPLRITGAAPLSEGRS